MTPLFDKRNSVPTIIKTIAPVRDLKGIELSQNGLRPNDPSYSPEDCSRRS